ncbi:bifunctional phosphopantothenoylcysteine decarboxylase/phosphopantothenate--cysteine ligase CoaBC [Epilithonimonas arachidiradicis]|uniref:Coenzyme A biosynthesis bifunctional protein CoaBC n=1 Tax=Epilithonimonas arachidiradicis TaxID=1617282 RepID=A0A420DD88_9FLAO|nr:bifunctional phosphopantothenoylcysteine decarboxylase/phosphopantothenate--cysteine ligase CoaBC [Epilithonimonas arachidiradicis]RKE89607.1 phosphopantothenoylcysteine decarboxylase/phosphopantothenate--cysteine ligase [Epilithonimonas arachidiradicis]GGG43908.1 phosphopantothenoylcysteine decarboxylase [Epilithonimonas arachidiradicis]
MSLQGKKLILGITGGIAAYKMNYLVRELIKAGAEVKVILTKSAEDFVSPLTFSTLSKNKVYTGFYDDNKTWNNHVELALWADLILIAPCTANTLAKISYGLCDNFLMAVYMSAKCPVVIAPAMDLDMYVHPTVTRNLQTVESFGHQIIPAEYGELASGLVGQGRLAEPETIFKFIQNQFDSEQNFAGKKFLITAGPTYENIDPVRFIGNHSSGKMGFDLAKEAARRGAEVILISGPSSQKVEDKKITLHKVTSAQEMFDEVFKYYDNIDVAIMSAAVADYTPKVKATEKIKKNENELTIQLVKNRDILRTMGEKKTHQFLVGFALETQNEEENAKGKLVKKNLDMIVLNSLRDEGAGFANATNKIKIFTPAEEQSFSLKSKEEVAQDILNFVAQKL